MRRIEHQSQSQCDVCDATGCFRLAVQFKGMYQRFCTSCVLKSYPGSFCPICFEFYDDRPPPPNSRLICVNCPSISHLSCVAPKPSNSSYRCPSCLDPKFSFYRALASKVKPKESVGDSPIDLRGFPVDKDLAIQLVTAARIAFDTMNRAAIFARVEAEKRTWKALFAKKRAKEALERVALLVATERGKERMTKGQNNVRPANIDASVSTSNTIVMADGSTLRKSTDGLQSTGHLRHKESGLGR